MDILDFFWTFYLNHLSPLWGYFLSTERSPHINVLNIEMEPRMGDWENWTKGKSRTLNQLKICISGF